MTIAESTPPSPVSGTTTAPPRRHRSGEARGARIGRPLRLVGRVRQVDEDLLDDLGQGYWRVDELAADLAAALRSRDEGVSHAQLRQALAGGVASVPDAPAVLRDFFTHVERTPEWVDWDLLEEGARVCRTFGRNAGDVLLQLSLIGGYRFGGPTDLLVATGALTGESTIRRLAETQHWTISVTEPGAMRPGAEGWRLTVHVRVMHALVNGMFDGGGRWDAATWGRPINQTDQAATLGLFSGTLLLGVRALGVPVSRADSRAVMHLWRYVGWLMGVDERWLFETEREQHAFSYHVLLSQGELTQAGRDLTQSIVDAQSQLFFRRHAWFWRWYAPRRLLSMLRPFLGTRSMRELGLPLRLPWASVLAVGGNVVRYRVLGRSGWGRRRIERWSVRYRDEQRRRYFGAEDPEVARL